MLTGSIASTSKKVEDHMEQFNKFDFVEPKTAAA